MHIVIDADDGVPAASRSKQIQMSDKSADVTELLKFAMSRQNDAERLRSDVLLEQSLNGSRSQRSPRHFSIAKDVRSGTLMWEPQDLRQNPLRFVPERHEVRR